CRQNPSGDAQKMIASVRAQESLRAIIKNKTGQNSQSSMSGETEIREDSKGEWAARVTKELVVLGSPTDVRHYSEGADANGLMGKEDLRRKTAFVPSASSASIV